MAVLQMLRNQDYMCKIKYSWDKKREENDLSVQKF